MKRIILIFFLLLFLIALKSVNAVKVDKIIEDELEENDEVSVIVMLKDDYSSIKRKGVLSVSSNNLKTKKEMIKEQQQKVLSNLNVENQVSGKKIIKAKSADFKLRHKYATVNAFSGKVTKKGLEKLKNNENVEKIYADRVLHIFLDASVPLINATKTWSLIYNNTNLTGAGETVCIIDTGVDYNHTNLGGGWGNKVIGGYNSISGAGGGGILGDQSCDINNTACYDDEGHGTHVAGIVASDNDTYRGVAPDAKIVAIKACNSGGSCNGSDVIAGIDWCTNNASKFNISVISMSLGTTSTYTNYCDDDYTDFRDVINTAVGQNISVVVAAGNNNPNDNVISSPACVQNATPIGAVDDDVITYNRAPNMVELLAPGVSIKSTLWSGEVGGFGEKSGTSMSAPHAAGAFALINQYRRLEGSRRLTPAEIEDALNDTGKAIADDSNTYRRINIYAAILDLDSVAPTINITYPANNSETNTSWVLINITSNEILTSAILEINNTNQTMNGSVLDWYFNKTNLTRASYSYKVYGNDSAGNIGVSETRIININNTIPTQPTLNLPLNNSYRDVNWTLLNWTAFDDDNDTVTCYVYGDNTTAASNLINATANIENGTVSTYNWTGLNETTYYWKAKCDDSYINSSFSPTFNFTIDLTYPKINFSGGTEDNNSYIEDNWIYVNVSVTENNFDNISFMLYNSTSLLNETNYTTAVYNINFTNLSDDSYYYNVTIRDKVGKTNSTKTRKITIDTTIPTTNVSLTSVNDSNKDGNIELNWTDDLVELYSHNLTITYRILRSTTKINSNNIANADLINNVTTNTTQFFEDNTTLHDTTYFYAIVTVDSFNRFNDSVFSVVLNATANDTIAPKEATNFNITGSGATATFRWYNVTLDTNNNPDEANLRYVIYYKRSNSAVNTSKSPINKTGWDGVAQNVTTNKSITWSTTTEGTYTYHFVVTTLDDAGNENLSLTTGANGNYGNVSLTYTAPSDNGGGGSGGGGGGAAAIVVVTTTNLEEKTSFETGFTTESVKGGEFSFKDSKGSKHTITITKVYTDKILLTINSSGPITITLKIGETKEVDIDNDGVKDISVKLVDIVYGKVKLIFKKLTKKVEEPVVEIPEEILEEEPKAKAEVEEIIPTPEGKSELELRFFIIPLGIFILITAILTFIFIKLSRKGKGKKS